VNHSGRLHSSTTSPSPMPPLPQIEEPPMPAAISLRSPPPSSLPRPPASTSCPALQPLPPPPKPPAATRRPLLSRVPKCSTPTSCSTLYSSPMPSVQSTRPLLPALPNNRRVWFLAGLFVAYAVGMSFSSIPTVSSRNRCGHALCLISKVVWNAHVVPVIVSHHEIYCLHLNRTPSAATSAVVALPQHHLLVHQARLPHRCKPVIN
jgi:hypothetical protein